jgi:hypothetical protein
MGNVKLEDFAPIQPQTFTTEELKVFEGTPEANNKIIECSFIKGRLIPLRLRKDKNAPNHITVANDIWGLIQDSTHPATYDDFLKTMNAKYKLKEENKQSIDEIQIRKFHNAIKRRLIDTYCTRDLQYKDAKATFYEGVGRQLTGSYREGCNILELGVGKGGDLWKYASNKFHSITALEPDVDYRRELEERKKELRLQYERSKIYFESSTKIREQYQPASLLTIANVKGQDTNDILDIPQLPLDGVNYVDVISSFFSLSFFFENSETFEGLLSTLNILKQNGLFIGCTVDGEALRELLKANDEVITGYVKDKDEIIYSIIGNEDLTSGLGQKVLFNFGTDSTVQDQTEYLVDWKMFVERMEKMGFDLLDSEIFEPPSYFRNTQKCFSELYRFFVFKREFKTINSLSISDDIVPADLGVWHFLNNPYSPLIVHTGSIGDGSCFVHSILRTIDPLYTKSGKEQRKAIGARARQLLALPYKITDSSTLVDKRRAVANWLKIVNNSFIGITVIEWSLFEEHDQISEKDARRISIKALYKYNSEYKRIFSGIDLSRSYTHLNSDLTYPLWRPRILAHLKEKALTKEENKSIDNIENKLSKFVDMAEELFVEILYKELIDIGCYIEDKHFSFIANYFNIDIYTIQVVSENLIKKNHRSIYRIVPCNHLTGNRTSVAVLFINGIHYEPLGRIAEDGSVQTKFNPNDPLIIRFRKETC